FGANDSLDTVAADIVRAINSAVKNTPALAAANPVIAATYSGNGVVNLGGDANTVFIPGDSGLTASGTATLPTGDNNILVRYAPADTQHDLSLAIAGAINNPVLDVNATADQVNHEQFQVSDGITTKTFEVTEDTAPAGVIAISIASGDSPATIASKIASALNSTANGFGSGSAVAEGNHVVLTLHGGSINTVGSAPNLPTAQFNVSATPELSQVQLQGPLTLTIPPTSAEFTSSIQRNLISRNDDYFGNDSYIGLELQPGVYYVGVSSTGNTQYDPNVHNSGWGGKTDGLYELRLNFRADAATQNSLVSFVNTPGVGLNALGQDTPQPLDGDADGAPGGAYNFWFNVGPTTFADKLGDSVVPNRVTVSGSQITLSPVPGAAPVASFTTIQSALASPNLQPGANLRVEGNGGASFSVPTAPTLATAIAGGQTFSINAGPTTSTFEFFQLGGDTLEVNSDASNALDGQTFTISQGNSTVTFEFALNGRSLAAGDKNTAISFRATDTKQALAGEIAQAISSAKSAGLFGPTAPINPSVGAVAAPDGNWVIVLGGDANTSYANVPTASTATSTSTLVLRRGGSGAPLALTNGAFEVTALSGNSVTNGSTFNIKQGSTTISFEFSQGRLTLPAGDNHVPVPYNLNGVNDSPAVLAGEIAQAINGAVTAGLFGGSAPIKASYSVADNANGRPVVTVGGNASTTLSVDAVASNSLSVLATGATVSPVTPGAEVVVLSPTDPAATIAAKMVPVINGSALGQIPQGAAGPQPVVASINATQSKTVVQLAQGPFRLTLNPGGTSLAAAYSDVPYQIGVNTDFSSPSGPPPLADGATFNVPKGVTAMIDPGAEFKMFHSVIDVGSASANIDRSQAALQVLGIPGNQAIFTSFNDNTVGGTLESPITAPARGDWGGLVFRNDSDLEPLGIFLNYVDETTFRYGGGTVSSVTGQPQQYDTIDLQTARPTVSNNIIVDAASAPISANPNSFEETHFGQDVTLSAGAPGDVNGTTAASQIVDGQTFQIHDTTFEFDNLNSPSTLGVLAGDVAIGYYGMPSGISNPHAVDTNAQLAAKIAAAINGAGLTAPFVQAAVTGNQVTITNVALDSAVAVQVPASGIQAGQTFTVKSTVFQFFNGDVLQVAGANGATGVHDGDTFTITRQGALNPVIFEFALDNRLVTDGNWPVNFTQTDTDEALGREVAAAINAAAAAGAFEGAPVAYQGLPSDGQTFTINRGGVSQTFEFVSDARMQAASDTNWPVSFASGVFSVDIAQNATGATIGSGGNSMRVT
ncbi:MAG TPA: hypothetical protein VFW87_09575, partial [Pirellulales bacterium]|nr:hypothetical protein [Pirellulales bacterium]